MTAVIVQCRLSSKRFPEKALKELGGKTIPSWTLNAMKKIKADAYYVATDEASEEKLRPIVESACWKLFVGPLDDVLARFCLLIKEIDADVVVRATADNPFLFYEAASLLLEEYEQRAKVSKCDYITFQGLPHGSGVEVFNAKSLLEAELYTQDAYDHEHVGPALYNHRNRFSSIMLKAPARFFHPEYRTTVDTPSDYRRARRVVQYLSGGASRDEPYTTEEIISAFETFCVSYPVLFIPTVKKGEGTGHLRRCLESASSISASVYVEKIDERILALSDATPGFAKWQLTDEWPLQNEYSLIVVDSFVSEKSFLEKLSSLSPLVCIDEGGEGTEFADYLLSIIPSLLTNKNVNLSDIGFMSLPVSVNQKKCSSSADVKKVLVTLGGEDPASLTKRASDAFADGEREVVAITNVTEVQSEVSAKITYLPQVAQLREKLSSCDLVVTHYGLTAYEASYAGVAVVLLATTPLHEALAKKYGFTCLAQNEITKENAKSLMENVSSLYPSVWDGVQKKHLGNFISELAKGAHFECPVCNSKSIYNSVVERTKRRTFRRCKNCSLVYIGYSLDGNNKDYKEEYFFSEYKNQYGKTYLEDFASIEKQGERRIKEIQKIFKKNSEKTLLDIGCAYGPFLSAASKQKWQVFGTDISEDAVLYVQSKLLFPSACVAFPNFDSAKEFGVKCFDAVTMWFVIEHFYELDKVLKTVSSLVKVGGVFAFSAPSGEGVSAKFNKKS
ncbi:MAG: methyltransferase domain-containing protein, partial [Treponema sp.]|nr:methyltransferase domain-containing protein [Treponema sp.]